MAYQTSKHPKYKFPRPEFGQGKQKYPGSESVMDPQPDYGVTSYSGSGKLKGKVALITGGDSGIGRAVALAFAKEGADLVISFWNKEEAEDAELTVKAIETVGQKVLSIMGDIRDFEQCELLVEQALQKLGRLDILVNNAAFQKFHESFLDITPEELDQCFRTNVFAPFYLSQLALPKMEKGGSIINVASVQAYHPSPALMHYASTKGALVTLTKGLAQEAVKYGVRVNAVAPGPVWTPLIPFTVLSYKQAQTFGQDSLWGRPAQPVELAPVFVLLASDEGAYITGEVYPVTGSIKVI